MPSKIDFHHQRFDRLVVVNEVKPLVRNDGRTRTRWRCRCDCGNYTLVLASALRFTKSCGCLAVEQGKAQGENNRRHGLSDTPTHIAWLNMRQRCKNTNGNRWHCYGGRGIKICVRWSKFENFLEDMGIRPEGMTLERKDVNGDYTPHNCKWATQKEQQNNRRNTGKNKALTA